MVLVRPALLRRLAKIPAVLRREKTFILDREAAAAAAKHDACVDRVGRLLGCTFQDANYIVSESKQLLDMDLARIEKAVGVLRRFGITESDICDFPKLLAVHPITLEHHAMVLEEGGFSKLRPGFLLRYLTLTKRPISAIKRRGFIQDDTDVATNFLLHLEEPPVHVPPYPTFSDADTFFHVHLSILKHYLAWRMELPPGEVDQMMAKYRRIHHKSFRHLRRTIVVLEDHLGFTKEKICSNGYLLHSHPDNTLDMVARIPTLGGVDIRTVLHKFPKIIMTATDTLLRTKKYLQDYNIPDEAVRRCFNIFTLGCESVRRRLELLHLTPEFRVLAVHPRVLRLVHHQHRAQTRLSYLQEQQIHCTSLHLLCTTHAKFERFLSKGDSHVRSLDVAHFVASHLSCSIKAVYDRLRHHPYWRLVPLLDIGRNLDTLIGLGYTKSEVLENVPILLYPRELVEKELGQVSTQQEVVQAQKLAGGAPLTGTTELALCLYYMERPHHFTGNGIWPNKDGESGKEREREAET